MPKRRESREYETISLESVSQVRNQNMVCMKVNSEKKGTSGGLFSYMTVNGTK